MRRLTFEEYQKEYASNFVKINEQFNKQGIFWFAHSGTLLGAQRNGKLIPWDDDIDMGMTAKEFYGKYEQIENICKEVGFKVADKARYPGMNSSRLISEEKVIVEYDGREYITSMFIDIMIALPVKRKSIIRSYYWFIICRVMLIFSGFWKPLPSYKIRNGAPKKVSWLEHFMTFIGRMFVLPFGLFYFVEKRAMKKGSKKDGKMYSFHYGWSHLNQYYDFNEMVESEIEATKIWVSSKWEEELIHRYGENYITPPPVEKQRPHHFVLTPYNGDDKEHKIYPYIIK